MSGCDASMRPGFSFARRKKGLFAYSSTIIALQVGTECAIWDWVLVVESEAIDEKKKNKTKTKFCLGSEKMKKDSENLLWYHIRNIVKERDWKTEFTLWLMKMKVITK